MACDCCGGGRGATTPIEICSDCLGFHDAQTAAVKARLAGPVNWEEIVRDGLYDRYGRKVAIVRNLTVDRIDVTPYGAQQREYVAGRTTIVAEVING